MSAATKVVRTLRVRTKEFWLRVAPSACPHTECADYFSAHERLLCARAGVLLPSLVAMLLAAMSLCAAVAEEKKGTGPEVIRFRRILAPEDRIKDWPLGDGKYLPVDAAEFERLVADLQSPTAGTPVAPAVAIGSARYEAKLVDGHLIGQASADVVLASLGPATLPLEPCNLALGKIAWDPVKTGAAVGAAVALPHPDRDGSTTATPTSGTGGAAASKPSVAVFLGLGADGKLQAIVDRSGRLRFDWSLAGHRDAADILGFLFEIPRAPANELSLELPEGFTPGVRRGVVVGSEPAGQQMRRWHIELGGNHRFLVRILPAGSSGRRPQLALLRQSTTYDFSLRGLEVSAHWRLQVHNQPLHQVTLLLDPGLQLVSARYGDASLPWSAVPLADGQGTRVVLPLSEPIRDDERVLRLNAVGSPVLDHPWRLPRIRAEGLFWQEGTITLLMPEPLLVNRIVPAGCAQTGTGPLSAPRVGEALQFQAFQPDATVDVSLARRSAALQLLSATAIDLGIEETTARVAADVRLPEGEPLTIAADVAPHWTIDAVESTPPEAVADWSLSVQPGGGQRLSIRLGTGLSPTQPLRLAIKCSRHTPCADIAHDLAHGVCGLRIDDLVPLRFRNAAGGKPLIAVQPAASYALKLSGGERLKQLRADDLSAAELALLANPPQDLLFEYGARANRLEVALVAQKAKYAGTIQIDAALDGGGLRESCRLRCVSESGRVDHVLVQFSPGRDTALRWTLGDDDRGQPSARKWSKEEQAAAGYNAALETWEVGLRRPRSAPFEITAVRSVPIRGAEPDRNSSSCSGRACPPRAGADTAGKPARYTGTQSTSPVDSSVGGAPLAISLASLPEATSQRGIVTVRSLGSRPLSIEHPGLKPTLPEPLPPNRTQAVRGVYRYNPARDIADGAAALRVFSQNGAVPFSEPAAWVWNCDLESRYQADGQSQHQATYDLQNSGCGRFRLTLPPDVSQEDIRSVSLDGNPIAWKVSSPELSRTAAVRNRHPERSGHPERSEGSSANSDAILRCAQDDRCVTVQLPPDRKFPRLAIQWTATGPPLGILGSLVAPLPEPDLPLLARHWTAWLPPGYDSRCEDGSAPSLCGWKLNWSRRLFGPLGRAADADRFDPLSADDWMTLLVELRSHNQVAEPADTQGWTVSQMELAAGSLGVLEFVHCTSMRLLGTIVFLLVAAVGCWNAAGSLRVRAAAAHMERASYILPPVCLVSLLGSFGAAAMVLPDAYVPLASGGVLGILFCLVWRWVWPNKAVVPAASGRQDIRTSENSDSPPGSTIVRTAQLGLIFLGVLLTLPLCGEARAETPPQSADQSAEKAVAAPPMYRVLVPVDVNKKPTGGKVYVPEPFYQELYRRAAAPAEQPQGWLILRATYQGVLAPEANSGRLGVDTLRAQYDLQVFGRATRVRIPLRTEGANLVPNGISLDGRPIEPQWDPDGNALAFDVAEPGECRLEVALRPTMPGGPDGFDVAIPRVAQSRLELTLPAGAPPLEVPSACGAVGVEKDPPRLVADLGPADRLTVRWHQGAASGTVGPAADVEQLVWLKVQPGSLVIDTKFKLHVLEGQVQQLQLAADPRLRLLPLPGDDPPTVQVGLESGQSRLIAFHWSRPVSDRLTLEATFLLSGATGVGNFHLPRLELLDARATKRWLAVSVDPALDRDERQKQRLETVGVGKFLKAWKGDGDTEKGDSSLLTPQAAYRLPAGEVDWTISTRPHEPRTTADQTLTLSFDEDRVDLLFEAQVSTASGYLFEHRLTVPKGCRIQEISLFNGDVERASRWSQDADGTVTVFLGGPVSGQQKLVLRGWLPVEVGKKWPLPQVRIERCQLHSSTIRLFRRPAVLLRIHGGRRQAVASSAGSAAKPELGRFVAAFSDDGSRAFPISVTVESSRQEPSSPLPLGEGQGVRASSVASKNPASLVGGNPHPNPLPKGEGNTGFVRLADIAMTWHADGTCAGAAAFDLEPGGAGECPLLLPDGYELLQMSVEGMPVAPKAVGDRSWRFPLASQRLPQRVEVFFCSARGVSGHINQNGRCTFDAPALGQWPVRQTLWTIIGPPSSLAGEPEDMDVVSPWQQEFWRLKSVAATIESAAAISSSNDPDETPRWYQPWARRFQVSRSALQRELAAAEAGKETAAAKRQADAIEKRFAEVARQLGNKKGDITDISEESVMPPFSRSRSAVRCCVEGWTNSLTLDCRPADRDWFSHRLGIAGVLVVLTGLAVVGLRRGRLTNTLRRWPHAAGAVLGLAWWLWLTPSVLGLGIALASVLAAGRERMRAKKSASSEHRCA